MWTVCAVAVLYLTVDRFHFKNHTSTDKLCQHYSNPQLFPEKKSLNSQSAEQLWPMLNKHVRQLNFMGEGMFRYWILTGCRVSRPADAMSERR